MGPSGKSYGLFNFIRNVPRSMSRQSQVQDYYAVKYVFTIALFYSSGIDLHSILPWQAPARFHDDHHKYFHCNFGHNVMIFDRFHGTMRRKDRRYGEDVFYGKGAPMKGKKE